MRSRTPWDHVLQAAIERPPAEVARVVEVWRRLRPDAAYVEDGAVAALAIRARLMGAEVVSGFDAELGYWAEVRVGDRVAHVGHAASEIRALASALEEVMA